MGSEKIRPGEAEQRLEQIYDRAKALAAFCTLRTTSPSPYFNWQSPWTSWAAEDQPAEPGKAQSVRLKACISRQGSLYDLAIASSLSTTLYEDASTNRLETAWAISQLVVHNQLRYVTFYPEEGPDKQIITPQDALYIPETEEILGLTERAFNPA